MWKWIEKYLKSNKEFEIRFGIIVMLDFFVIDEYIDAVLERLNNIENIDEYYVKMAIAWNISICFVKYPEKTMKFLKHNQLDDFTYNKALQKIIESYRVEEETKKVIRNMKR